MNLLLLYPPDNPELLVKYAFEPLGLETIAATVPEHDVQIVDMRMESYKGLDRILAEFQPQLIGVSVNNTIYVNEARQLMRHVRAKLPEAALVVGGQHVSAVPQDFYHPDVDAIFTGWADTSFPAYVKALANDRPPEDIPGLIVLEEGKVVMKSPNSFFRIKPEDIRTPRRDLIKKYWKKYRNEVLTRTALVNTARGCPFKCSFCSVWKSVGGHFMVRSAEDVFEELKSLPKDVRFVFFADDNTFVNVKRANRLAELIENSDLKLQYSGYCRSDTIVRYPEMIERWHKIGLVNLCVGFEAVDNEQLKKINKKNKSDINQQAAELLHSMGQHFRPHFLVDPDFEKPEFKKIWEYVDRLGLASPVFTMLTPLPGTEFYEANKSRIHKGYDFFDFAHWVYPPRLGPEKFLENYSGLYHRAYSIRRHTKIFLRKWADRLRGKPTNGQHHMHIPLLKLLIFRMVSIFWERKLRRQYAIGASRNGGQEATDEPVENEPCREVVNQ